VAVAVLERIITAGQVNPADEPSREVRQVVDVRIQYGHGDTAPRIASGGKPRGPRLT
jgi:hypothetical protein